jgi:hypothetical protein
MRKILLLAVAAMMATMDVCGQIPANILEVKDTYYLREITMPAKMANLTMTVTKVTRGCNDSHFKLDMNRYKNAVVVRK